MNAILIGVGFILLIVAAMRLTAYRLLRGTSLRDPTVDLTTPEEVPAALRQELDEGLLALLPLGFQARGYTRSMGIVADDPRPLWSALGEQAQHGTWVQVFANVSPEAEVPLRACFLTPLADGRVLISAEGFVHLFPVPYADAILLDHGEADLVASGRRHLAELGRHQCGSPFPDAAAFVARHQALNAAYLPMLRARELVATDPTGRVRFTPAAAWAYLGRIRSGQGAQVRALLALRKQRGGARGAVPAAIEADAVLRQEEMVERRVSAGSSLPLFLLTLLAFVATAPLVISGGIPVPLILAILLFHESGHFLAMRACGYRDTRIFFLPLFGAAASGRKRDATIPQQVLVSLMGPLPGIIVGLALLAWAHADRHSALFQPGLMLVAINLFNLLPVLPLDGGQILCRVLFARRPWLDLVFRAVAAVAMIALGLATSPILIYLGIFLAIGLAQQRQIARLRSRVMRDPAIAGLAGEPLTVAVCAAVARDAVTGRMPFAHRLRMVRDIAAALGQPRITTTTRVALLGTYVGAFLLAPGALLIWRLAHH